MLLFQFSVDADRTYFPLRVQAVGANNYYSDMTLGQLVALEVCSLARLSSPPLSITCCRCRALPLSGGMENAVASFLRSYTPALREPATSRSPLQNELIFRKFTLSLNVLVRFKFHSATLKVYTPKFVNSL
jgi:hypothetical protein